MLGPVDLNLDSYVTQSRLIGVSLVESGIGDLVLVCESTITTLMQSSAEPDVAGLLLDPPIRTIATIYPVKACSFRSRPPRLIGD